MAKIIVLGTMKGGVGKSVSTFNLAYSLAELGKKVLAVDLDPQGNMTSGLGVEKKELENTIFKYSNQLSKLNYLLEEKDMKEEIFEKIVPAYYVYYKEGILKDYSEASEFIMGSGQECMELNPNIRCIEPDYCYVN